jgi:hypothetical protein
MAAPLAPLALELGLSGSVSIKSATLTICLYALALANSSRDATLFGLGIVVAIVMAVVFGIVTGGTAEPSWAKVLTWICTGTLAATHGAERYNRHIIGLEPFWEFMKIKDEKR